MAFEILKERLTYPPVLTFEIFEDPFQVETGASSVAASAVLPQKKADGKMHPIHFAIRAMNNAERDNSFCKREALAVISALKTFRVHLLLFQYFGVVTDHQSL